jgi:antitoxin CptB
MDRQPHPLSSSKGTSNTAHLDMDDRRMERLRWRCRRGLLELDLILLEFLEHRFQTLSPPEQEAFTHLLSTPDNTLLAYIHGTQNPAEKELMQIITIIR